jgi:hypothetical protein
MKGDEGAYLIHDDVYTGSITRCSVISMRRSGAIGRFWHHRIGTMQNPANGFRRIPLLGTSVNKDKKGRDCCTQGLCRTDGQNS